MSMHQRPLAPPRPDHPTASRDTFSPSLSAVCGCDPPCGPGRSLADDAEDRPGATATLRVAAAGGVHVARAAGAVGDGPLDLHISQRVAEADVHRLLAPLAHGSHMPAPTIAATGAPNRSSRPAE